MSLERGVSRRESLRTFGAVGAAAVLGNAAALPPQAGPKPAGNPQDIKAANVVDVAVSRMAKGHS